MFLARFNSDGKLDSTFADNGWLISRFGTEAREVARSLVIMPDDSIMVGASTNHVPSTLAGNMPTANATINLLNKNVFGSLYVNQDLDLGYDIDGTGYGSFMQGYNIHALGTSPEHYLCLSQGADIYINSLKYRQLLTIKAIKSN